MTTIAQPHADEGRATGEMLIGAAASFVDRRRLLRTQLQVRGSSGPARA